MTPVASFKLHTYFWLCAGLLLAGVFLGRPALVIIAAPFGVFLALALSQSRSTFPDVSISLSNERMLEGKQLTVHVELTAAKPIHHVEVHVQLPLGLHRENGLEAVAVTVTPKHPTVIDIPVRCDRWGVYLIGRVRLRVSNRFGLLIYEREVTQRQPLKVFPRQELLRRLIAPLHTHSTTGNQVSRERGDGIEFADIRAFVPGDEIRRVNWRASARTGAIFVNERHPERNAEVALFLDTFAAAGSANRNTLTSAVRAATTLAQSYLRSKHRVGLVTFGGTVSWLAPSDGLVSVYRIIDALLESEITFSYAWKNITVLPHRVLSPGALIIAVTPLIDARGEAALLDIHARGFDLAVVGVSPVPFVPPGATPAGKLAYRLWLLNRQALLARYRAAGIAVSEWDPNTSLQNPVWELSQFRRSAQPIFTH